MTGQNEVPADWDEQRVRYEIDLAEGEDAAHRSEHAHRTWTEVLRDRLERLTGSRS